MTEGRCRSLQQVFKMVKLAESEQSGFSMLLSFRDNKLSLAINEEDVLGAKSFSFILTRESEPSIRDLADLVEKLWAKNKTLEGSVKTLEQSNKTLKGSVKTLEQSNKTLEQSNKMLKGSVKTLERAVKTLSERVPWQFTRDNMDSQLICSEVNQTVMFKQNVGGTGDCTIYLNGAYSFGIHHVEFKVEGGQKWISFGVCPNNETAANALGVCSVEYDGWYKRIYYQSSDMEYEKLTHDAGGITLDMDKKSASFLINQKETIGFYVSL
eukprot:CAMPEP_0168517522 /NCGR_PEP_ID=MMETSP0405-20121227/6093_1 /TAXON_ID=498012 /ORGANISM="Trichosphaerium sp, Strain Am-I-7 wt" /LENGTH=267 /DNA_ID=CAMNT_0008537531 /DNA_START=214 /DNA_END=1017 /DNA_ORIENTATION=-